MLETVIKRNGTREPFDANKLNKWAEFASNTDISWSLLALNTMKKLSNNCSTNDIHKAMISSCIDMKTDKAMNMAARLLLGQIYKEAHNGPNNIPTLVNFYHDMVNKGLWSKMPYDDMDLIILGSHINHNKNNKYQYAVLRQYHDKYLIKDNINNVVHESPQFAMMGIAMAAMQNRPSDRRIDDIIAIYNILSDLKINLPTPYLNGLRTAKNGYASCCIIKANDSAESIGVAQHIAYTMTCKQAGIGYYLESRSVNDGVRNNTVKHMGKLPYYRGIDTAVKANRQATRGGSATVSFLALDPEIEVLLRLKNPKTVASERIITLDYSLGINGSLLKRAAKNQDWYLFSYKDAPHLYELYFNPYWEKFDYEMMKAVENGVKHKKVSARDILSLHIQQRADTGRQYRYFTDNMNSHTPFKDTIYSSNLCQEVTLPTKGYKHMTELYQDYNTNGEVAMCFLSSLVAGRIKDDEYETVAYYTLLLIDCVIDLMEFPFENIAFTAKARRSVGIGITNLAYYLADKGLKYSSIEGKKEIHKLAEKHSFALHKASLRLGKELGNADWIDRTKYPEGWLPIDTYSKKLDEVINEPLHCDWESLRKDIIDNGGIRNSVLESFMPNESSSLASYTTNSLYPIRGEIVAKKSQQGMNYFIAPDWDRLKNIYENAYDISTKDMIEVYAIVQKFTGQAISADFYVDFEKIDGVSITEELKNLFYMYQLGLKTNYYLNSNTSVGSTLADENNIIPNNQNSSQVVDIEEDCEACKL